MTTPLAERLAALKDSLILDLDRQVMDELLKASLGAAVRIAGFGREPRVIIGRRFYLEVQRLQRRNLHFLNEIFFTRLDPDFFRASLKKARVPLIPQVRFAKAGLLSRLWGMLRLRHQAGRFGQPPLVIGKGRGHRGTALRVHSPRDLLALEPDELMGRQFSPFVYPEGDRARDIRVIRLVGRPPLIYARRASQPLLDEKGELAENPPDPSRVLTNIGAGGDREPVPEAEAAEAGRLAEQVFKAISEGERAFRQRVIAPLAEVELPFASCDFLVGRGAKLYFQEFHITPTWKGIAGEEAAASLVDALAENVAQRLKQQSLKRALLSADRTSIGGPLAAALRQRGVALA